MAIPYRPPGVGTVTRGSASPLVPIGDNPTIPALVGRARGYEAYTEQANLTGTTTHTLAKEGIITPLTTVVKATTNEVVLDTNYIVAQSSPSSNTIEGDEETTIRRIGYPAAPTLASSAGALTGTYRYAVAWVYDDDEESGLDPANVAQITLTTQKADLSAIPVASPPAGVEGRAIYRSKNMGTSDNPIWGPWYRVTILADLITTTYSDNNSDSTVAANPQAQVGIASGETLYIQYNYADQEYYEPTLFDNLNDIIAKYGTPFDDAANINSELSFGANLAFFNGASQVVCVGLPDDADATDISNGLLKLVEDEDVDLVVVLDGAATTVSAVNAHVNAANNRKYYRVGLVARDGVAATVTNDTLRSAATSINNRYIQYYDQPVGYYYNPISRSEVPVGGQYIAAAIAGMYAARQPSDVLSRAVIAGFTRLGTKKVSDSVKNANAAAGLTVIEELRTSGTLRIRHSISTNASDIANREFHVALCENNMLQDALALIDGLVTTVKATPLAATNIAASFRQVLERKVQTEVIRGYSGLTARPTSGDPTTYDVSWQYTPLYTINNINISFSINLNTGTATISGNLGGGASNLIL